MKSKCSLYIFFIWPKVIPYIVYIEGNCSSTKRLCLKSYTGSESFTVAEYLNVILLFLLYICTHIFTIIDLPLAPWMKEVKGIRHRGRGVYLRCPVFTTVQFSLRNEGSSEYVCLCEGREILSPNFQTFQDPGINSTELADWLRKPFIFLLHSHYYIYRRNWFLGHFCPP